MSLKRAFYFHFWEASESKCIVYKRTIYLNFYTLSSWEIKVNNNNNQSWEAAVLKSTVNNDSNIDKFEGYRIK